MDQTQQMKRIGTTYMGQRGHLSHEFVTEPRRQRAVAIRMGMWGLDDRSARHRLDEYHRTVILHLCRGVVDALPLGPLGVDLAFDLDLFVDGRRWCRRHSSSER